jgi:hypothetical protein
MSTISPARKRHRSSAHENVDAALCEWFKEKRNQNFPISEPILMAKSEEFATKLGDRDFSPNTGWLDRFKQRHGMVCRSMSGDSAVVDTDICGDWLKNKLPNLVKSYKACDIFNADETELLLQIWIKPIPQIFWLVIHAFLFHRYSTGKDVMPLKHCGF